MEGKGVEEDDGQRKAKIQEGRVEDKGLLRARCGAHSASPLEFLTLAVTVTELVPL